MVAVLLVLGATAFAVGQVRVSRLAISTVTVRSTPPLRLNECRRTSCCAWLIKSKAARRARRNSVHATNSPTTFPANAAAARLMKSPARGRGQVRSDVVSVEQSRRGPASEDETDRGGTAVAATGEVRSVQPSLYLDDRREIASDGSGDLQDQRSLTAAAGKWRQVREV